MKTFGQGSNPCTPTTSIYIHYMKQKTIITTEYYADDGTKFSSADECKRYESETLIPQLYLSNKADIDIETISNYIDMIIGQYNVITDINIQQEKIVKMLTLLKNKICPAYCSNNKNN